MNRIIALFGPQGCGKTTLAKAIIQSNPEFKRVRFAGTIYKMAEVFFGGPIPDDKEEPRLELGGRTLREFLQLIGTEFGRAQFGENIWIDACFREIDAAFESGHSVVIDDLRFENEFQALRSRDAIMVEIIREGYGPKGVHASERDWLEFNAEYVIENDSPSALAWKRDGIQKLLKQAHCERL